MSSQTSAVRVLVLSFVLALAPRVWTAELPVPCAAGTCGAGKPEVFVTSGAATYSTSGQVGTIHQTSDRAVLNWQSFNVDAGAQVVFEQPRDISVALNRIYQQDPNRILGAITANGQVYLINPNGMIFGANAKVSTNTLLASSLDIPDSVFTGSGLAGAIDVGAGVAALTATVTSPGEIDIEKGALLETQEGGRIWLFAPKIVNEGKLVTPGGQTILGAAKDKVFLDFSADPALRGFLVEVVTGGEVTNLGEIIAERGNITLAGLLVNQQGVLSATTSVRENGSIRLAARDGARTRTERGSNVLFATRAGTLTVGEGSLTSVVPDTQKNETAPDSQAQGPSKIELMGKEIVLAGGSTLLATGGEIEITATIRPDNPLADAPRNESSLVVEGGAVIDVSGDRSSVLPMSRNQIDLDLRSNELADSPLQRDGVLRGETVSIDARIGSEVANVDGAIANVPRAIGERLAQGGRVTLGSEGRIALESGSKIDLSGGAVLFDSGFVGSSQLMSGGRVIDIGQADAQRTYDSVFSGASVTHDAWGITEHFEDTTGTANRRFEEGYIEGKDAGSLDIVAHALTLDGAVAAGTTSGRHQRLAPSGAFAFGQRPFEQLARRGSVDVSLDPTLTTIVAVTVGAQVNAPADEVVVIRPAWFEGGALGSFKLTTYGGLQWQDDADLDLAGGTALSLSAASIEFDGGYFSPGGSLKLTSAALNQSVNAPLSLGARAYVNVAGVWVNDAPERREVGFAPAWIDGGDVNFRAAGDFVMARGAFIDVSGGAWFKSDETLLDGHGGSISLTSSWGAGDSLFVVQSGLVGYGLRHGGSLRLEANALALYEGGFGGVVLPLPPDGPDTEPPWDDLDFMTKVDASIPSEFLQARGFESFDFTANRYGTVVNNDAYIRPVQLNYLLPSDYRTQASGRYLSGFAAVGLLPDAQRNAVRVGLGFAPILGARVDGSVVVQPGARLEVDPGGSINLSSGGSIWVRGELLAPAGEVGVRIGSAGAFPTFIPSQSIRIAAGAALRAPGAFVDVLNPLGLRQGLVLGGGVVEIDAARGFLITEAGSTIDVGGTAAVLDITRSSADTLDAVLVASDAGVVRLSAAEGGVIAGTISGDNVASAAPGEVRGATVDIRIDPNRRGLPTGDPSNPNPGGFPVGVRSVVATEQLNVPAFEFGDAVPTSLRGRLELDPVSLAANGVDSLALRAFEQTLQGGLRGSASRIVFESDLDLALRRALTLDTAAIEASGSRSITLAAPTVTLGYDFFRPESVRPLAPGTGLLSVDATTIDVVGSLRFNGYSRVDLNAHGDVQLRGTVPRFQAREYVGSLDIQGDLGITAARLLPTTLTQFDVRVAGGPSARLEIAGAGSPDTRAFSFGGSLRLAAPNIDVSGRIVVPQGSIDLAATGDLNIRDGALLSTVLSDELTLFGQTQSGLDWIYPFPDNVLRIIDRLPEKSISLAGARVATDAGSRIDLGGGGKVIAYEFLAGPGGSEDFLATAAAAGAFVILPTDSPAFAPFEPLESAGFGYTRDTGVELTGTAGLPNGEYAVVPTRFAFLPGALLVTPVAGQIDLVPGEVRTDVDGAPIVAGRFTVLGTDAHDSRWSAFKVVPGAFADEAAEYSKTSATDFFGGRTSAVPEDGGRISIAGTTAFALAGDVDARGAAGGVDGTGDISANRIAIVADASQARAGFINIVDDGLNRVQVGSLLVGGIRSVGNDGVVDVDVRATELVVESGAQLARSGLVLAARSRVLVSAGASIEARGEDGMSAEDPAEDSSEELRLDEGAALAVSARGGHLSRRTNASGTAEVVLEAGSSVVATGSVDVSAAGSATFAGDLRVDGGRLAIDVDQIGLGTGAPPPRGESRLSRELLEQANAAQYELTSRKGLRVYGAVELDVASVRIDGPAIDAGSTDASLLLRADAVALANGAGGTLATATAQGGRLVVDSSSLQLDPGAMAIRGFDVAELRAADGISAVGTTSLRTSGDLILTTPRVAPATGAEVVLVAAGAVRIDKPESVDAASAEVAEPALGATLRIEGATVDVASRLESASGSIDLHATQGDVRVLAGADISVAGVALPFGPTTANTEGGRIALSSSVGGVFADTGSVLDVGGGADERAGSIEVTATGGTIDLRSEILGGRAGSFRADGRELAGLAALNQGLETGGFGGERGFRQRQGDLAIGAGTTLASDRIVLSADAGRVVVGGVLQLTGLDSVATLSGGTGVTINGSVGLADAGAIVVNALRPDANIVLGTEAAIDAGDGELVLRLGASDDLASRLVMSAGQVSGRTLIDVVATVAVDDGVFDTLDQALLATDLATVAIDAGQLRDQVGGDTRAAVSAHITSATDLAIQGEIVFSTETGQASDQWDLFGWRFADVPGTILLSSDGDIRIETTISDGFSPDIVDFGFGRYLYDRLRSGAGWNLVVVAGADAGSANPLDVRDGTGNISLAPGRPLLDEFGQIVVDDNFGEPMQIPAAVVRTGTGNLTVRAGDSLVFEAAESGIYTAGETTGSGGFTEETWRILLHGAEFPENGGDVDIEVGGDIKAVRSRQLVSQYVARFGGEFFDTVAPTMYGIVFDVGGKRTLGQNLGSFGGGDVRIDVAGDIRDLAVVVPDSLQHAGDAKDSFDGGGFEIEFTDNTFLMRGAADVSVRSGGDVIGGFYYLGSGDARVRADSIIPAQNGLGALFAGSDAAFDVRAQRDLWVESFFNPTMLPQSFGLQDPAEASYFFTYSDRARLDTQSLVGDVTFSTDVLAIRNSVDFSSETRADRALDIFPAAVTAKALSGDVIVAGNMTLFPAQGGLGIYARNNVRGPVEPRTLLLSDADAALLPNVDRPQNQLLETVARLPRGGIGDPELIHAGVPVHTGDNEPSEIYVLNGSIDAPQLSVVSSEAMRFNAREDVAISQISVQHVASTDVTSIISGGDISIQSRRNPDTGQVITNSRAIRLAGPGELQVLAGRSIDLGSSVGIQTTGDLQNPALPDAGADIVALAGNGGIPNVTGFLDIYLTQSDAYHDLAIGLAEEITGSDVASIGAARSILAAAPLEVQRSLAIDIFFAEIKSSGIAAAQLIAAEASKEEIDAAYANGNAAIENLFPAQNNFIGDVRLFFSQITSLDGGDIRILAPGGLVNAGLASSSISTKTPDQLGIVAQRRGDIDVYAEGDVLVNQSRVFALEGGDINIWSAEGDVDAGRGAKSSLGTPALSAALGENDSVAKRVPPSISGSGIAAAAAPDGTLPDIVLSTPNGVVDAGDAGIRTPGRLFTAANEFLGRDNIEVGSLVGAPVGSVALSADLASVGDTAASAAQDVAKTATDASEKTEAEGQLASAALGWLEVFLEGYGDADAQCDPARDPSCRAESR